MLPVAFPGVNATYAKDQPEYIPLPVFKRHDGLVLSCWRMSWRERLRVLLTGRVWVGALTFHKPLQPLMVMTTACEILELEAMDV